MGIKTPYLPGVTAKLTGDNEKIICRGVGLYIDQI